MVAIKGMEEMPKSCAECSFVVDDMCGGATCILLYDEWKDNENHRAENCPLTEIITCKNCKHCYHMTDAPKVLVCEKHNCQQVSKNFFCADGERKE